MMFQALLDRPRLNIANRANRLSAVESRAGLKVRPISRAKAFSSFVRWCSRCHANTMPHTTTTPTRMMRTASKESLRCQVWLPQNSTFGAAFTAAASAASSSKKFMSLNPNMPATMFDGKVFVASLYWLTERL